MREEKIVKFMKELLIIEIWTKPSNLLDIALITALIYEIIFNVMPNNICEADK